MTDSLLQTLQKEQPQLRSQVYFKSTLTALSHALEDVVLKGDDQPLVIANFQQERFYQQEIRRYERIAKLTDHVYVLAAPERESGFAVSSGLYESVPLSPADDLTREWHLIIISPRFAACLVCREQGESSAADPIRRFEGFWGFDRPVSNRAAQWLLQRIADYRPELKLKVQQTLDAYDLDPISTDISAASVASELMDSSIFGQRLTAYLQASQYKLLKAYRVLDDKSQQERLLNIVTVAIRRSLKPEAVLNTAVAELGRVFNQCRCIFYRCQATDAEVTVDYESVPSGMPSLAGQAWSLTDNPLIQVALSQERATVLATVSDAPVIKSHSQLQAIAEHLDICAWLLMPIQYQGTVLGMVELHWGTNACPWRESDIALVEALATQVGVALFQADMFTKSAILNQQLQALERTQQNLINIVGHELRTPLSTIQVCLESLESEPSMVAEIRQIMLETALSDTARMRKLIGDFLLLSRLESQQEKLQPELMEFDEALTLAISGIKANAPQPLPDIQVQLPSDLPAINIDGEGLVEVLTKLLDNACKFTLAEGRITVSAEVESSHHSAQESLMVKVEDTGRGIEPEQLQTIFNSFYQGEDFLRRSVGGTGLGLSICRQIIKVMEGEIWAESEGRDRGSTFCLRLPIEGQDPQKRLQPLNDGTAFLQSVSDHVP